MDTKLKLVESTSYASMQNTDQIESKTQNLKSIHGYTYDTLIDEIKHFLDDKKGLDVYQLLAFKWNKPKPEIKQHQNSYQCVIMFEKLFTFIFDNIYLKVLICLFVQIASIIVLYIYLFGTVIPQSGRQWCDVSDEFEHVSAKIMAIGYTSFLTLIIGVELSKSLKVGFYGIFFKTQLQLKLKYNKDDDDDICMQLQVLLKYVSYKWLIFGHFINFITLLNVLALSFIIIFFQSDPLQIILNAVVLLFVVNVDEQVIYQSDYDDILEWFDNKENTTLKEEKSVSITHFVRCSACYLAMFSWISIFSMILGLAFAIFTAACY